MSFWSIQWAWIALIILITGNYALWAALRLGGKYRFTHVAELSPKANELLVKFGHYYKRPYAGWDASSAASAVSITAIGVALVSAFRANWFWLLAGMVGYYLMANIARQFNPSRFMLNDEERAAHREILDWIEESQRRRIERTH